MKNVEGSSALTTRNYKLLRSYNQLHHEKEKEEIKKQKEREKKKKKSWFQT